MLYTIFISLDNSKAIDNTEVNRYDFENPDLTLSELKALVEGLEITPLTNEDIRFACGCPFSAEQLNDWDDCALDMVFCNNTRKYGKAKKEMAVLLGFDDPHQADQFIRNCFVCEIDTTPEGIRDAFGIVGTPKSKYIQKPRTDIYVPVAYLCDWDKFRGLTTAKELADFVTEFGIDAKNLRHPNNLPPIGSAALYKSVTIRDTWANVKHALKL